MVDNTTIEKLHNLRLTVMAKSFESQIGNKDFTEMSFEERVGIMVDAECTARKNNRLTRLIKGAKFPFHDACLEDIEYHSDRNLDKVEITKLGTCNYIGECHNIIIMGATGSGKTYLANAFGMAACRNFLPTRYVRLPDLFSELAMARAEGNYLKLIKQYQQVKLLILDEWLLHPTTEIESRDLLEITESRYKKASTIFCSQFEIGGWHQKIGASALAEAVCDRIVHDSYKIIIAGKDSMRKRKGIV